MQSQEDDEFIKITSELELVIWDLEDHCTETAKYRKDYLTNRPNSLQKKIDNELEHAKYIHTQGEKLLQYKEDIPYELQRNFTILTKSGDNLLSDEDFKTLVTFANKNEDLSRNGKVEMTISNDNETEILELNKIEYLNILQNSKNISELEFSWSSWQNHMSKYNSEYPHILKLVTKAAAKNDKYDAKTYWEMLSEYEDLYEKVDLLWEELQPVYEKLHNFVRVRINHYYKTNYTDNIPVYLLGSNLGNDWSNIADIILPHPQILHDINEGLNKKTVKDIYKMSEIVINKLNMGRFGKQFWKSSKFNMQSCDNEVLTYCNTKYSELLTCPNTTWPQYLNTYQTALRIALARVDYSPYAQQSLRYNCISEAVLAMGDLLAVAQLPEGTTALLPRDVFTPVDENAEGMDIGERNRMNVMLLLALKVFPSLGYYYSVDRWRREVLDGEVEDIGRSWWELRQNLLGINGVTNDELDIIDDPFITRNKPYVNKFAGLILQFQILRYYQLDIFSEDADIVQVLGQDADTFLAMLKDRPNKIPEDLINYYYSIDLSADSLIEFFKPLLDYLEVAPLEQGAIVTTTTTTSTTTTTTKPPPVKHDSSADQRHRMSHDSPDAGNHGDSGDKSDTLSKTDKVVPMVKESSHNKTDVTSGSSVNGSDKPSDTASSGMYILIGVVCSVVVLTIGALVWKKFKRKPTTNNRRFET